jgi:hypothetical protein
VGEIIPERRATSSGISKREAQTVARQQAPVTF